MNGARTAASPLPPAPLPAGSIAARRRVHPDGRIMVNKQPMKLGPRHAGELVTVIIEDTCYRILHGEDVDMRPGLPPASAGGSHPPTSRAVSIRLSRRGARSVTWT